MGIRFIDGAARDAHLAGDLDGRAALCQLCLNRIDIDLGGAPAVDTSPLRGRDTFGLARKIGCPLIRVATREEPSTFGRWHTARDNADRSYRDVLRRLLTSGPRTNTVF